MRRAITKKRAVSLDIIYSDEYIEKLINSFMLDGKKSIARDIAYRALKRAGMILELDPQVLFEKVLGIITLDRRIKKRKVGGSVHLVPTIETNIAKARYRSIKKIGKLMKEHEGKKSEYRKTVLLERKELLKNRDKETTNIKDFRLSTLILSNLIIDTYNKKGLLFKMIEEEKQILNKNKALEHFSW